jgi:hypothetical protein
MKGIEIEGLLSILAAEVLWSAVFLFSKKN